MKKRYLMAVGLLTLFVGLVLGVLALRPQPQLTEEKIAAIDVGMSIDEVEKFLGFEPGDYSAHGRCLPINMQFYVKSSSSGRKYSGSGPRTHRKDQATPWLFEFGLMKMAESSTSVGWVTVILPHRLRRV